MTLLSNKVTSTVNRVERGFDKARLVILLSSLGYAILPVALYYSWVKRNSLLFGLCLFLICAMSVVNIIMLNKLSQIRKGKEAIVDWIKNIEDYLSGLKDDSGIAAGFINTAARYIGPILAPQ